MFHLLITFTKFINQNKPKNSIDEGTIRQTSSLFFSIIRLNIDYEKRINLHVMNVFVTVVYVQCCLLLLEL